MNPPAKRYTFEYVAQKHGIPIERLPFLKKVYTDNCHDVVILHNKLLALNLSKEEMQMVLTFHGGFVSGMAIL